MENEKQGAATSGSNAELSAHSMEELHEICLLTARLVELRQNECKHLCIENVGPEIFHSLLSRLTMHKMGQFRIEI